MDTGSARLGHLSGMTECYCGNEAGKQRALRPLDGLGRLLLLRRAKPLLEQLQEGLFRGIELHRRSRKGASTSCSTPG